MLSSNIPMAQQSHKLKTLGLPPFSFVYPAFPTFNVKTIGDTCASFYHSKDYSCFSRHQSRAWCDQQSVLRSWLESHFVRYADYRLVRTAATSLQASLLAPQSTLVCSCCNYILGRRHCQNKNSAAAPRSLSQNSNNQELFELTTCDSRYRFARVQYSVTLLLDRQDQRRGQVRAQLPPQYL